MVTDELVETAIETIAAVPSLAMNPGNLVDDVERLAQTWTDAEQFVRALASTQRALRQLSAKRVAGRPLSGVFEGWSSYHYQSMRTSKHPADMRIDAYRIPVRRRCPACARIWPSLHSRRPVSAGKQQRALPRITPCSRPRCVPLPGIHPPPRTPHETLLRYTYLQGDNGNASQGGGGHRVDGCRKRDEGRIHDMVGRQRGAR